MSLEKAKKLLKETYGHYVSYENDFGSSIKECEFILAKSKHRLDLFGINDVELLSLILLERNAFCLLQSGVFCSNKNDFQIEWERNMDSLLTKTPETHKKLIYRNDRYCDLEQIIQMYKENRSFKVEHYFTCSKEFLGYPKVKFLICPLKKHSRAHNVYMIYNFGRNLKYGKPEWQIEYERGTEFKINKIKQKGGYYIVHLMELQNNNNVENEQG